MVGVKRKCKSLRTISREEFLERINRIDIVKKKALVCLLYLTGARVSELVGSLGLCFAQIKMYPSDKKYILIEELNVIKQRKGVTHKYCGGKVFQKDWVCLKCKKVIDKSHEAKFGEGKIIKRSVLVNLEKEKPFIIPVLKYMAIEKKLQPNFNVANKLFNFGRARAWRIVRKHFPEERLFPHYFRHLRATHLATVFGFDQQRLVKYFGWTSSMSADYYVKLRVQDLEY